MKINNLKKGKTYSNFKELCEVLEVKYPKSQTSKNKILKELRSRCKIERRKHKIRIVDIYEQGFVKIESSRDSKYDKLMQKLILGLIIENKWISERDFLKDFCIENTDIRDIWRRNYLICEFLEVDSDLVLFFDIQLSNVLSRIKNIKNKIDDDLDIYKNNNCEIEEKEIKLLKNKIKKYIEKNMFNRFKKENHKIKIRKILKLYYEDGNSYYNFLKFLQKNKNKLINYDNEMSSKGRYTISCALKRKEEFQKVRSIVYKIECWDEYEDFYKIGITSLTTKKRFDVFNIPYKYRIIDEIHTNLYEAILLENKLHKENKKHRYFPKKKFGGWTECFSQIDNIYGKA